jgi:hypothetical protein
MQVPLGVDVVKGLGVDTKGHDPGVELTSSQHNHLLDQDPVAAVLLYMTPRSDPSARVSKDGKKE